MTTVVNGYRKSSQPVVMTCNGEVRGSFEWSRSGTTYMSFRSIPYAQPPIGRLRFANPRPMDSWLGGRDVRQDAPYCTQYNIISAEDFDETAFFGQEDCLYLSVFTHKADMNRKRPVMVFIHGGGFESWTGAKMHGPEYFMDRDLVLVFINYRLGPFGYLSTEDNVIPGNFGLKDQLMGLKWVKENIAKFGGDPDSVTLFGESAGAASVHFHMKSSQSRGLFNRAILNSGSIYSPWALQRPGVARRRAMTSASLLSCPSDSLAFLSCLRGKTTANIIRLRHHFAEWDTDPFVVFGPVVERSGGFFTHDDLSRKTNVTLLTGIVSQEGAIKVAALISRKFDYLTQLMAEFENWAPLTFGYGRAGEYSDLSAIVKRHYFNNMDSNSISHNDFLMNLTQVYTDAWFASGYFEALNDHKGKVYRYKLDRKPQVSFVDIVGARFPPGVMGASHGDDLIYFFNLTRSIPAQLLNSEDRTLSEIMVNLWSDFIMNGSPGGIWVPSTDDDTLIITQNGELTMAKIGNQNYSTDLWHHLEKAVLERSNSVRPRG